MDITSYLLGKKAGGGSAPVLQDKEVEITENGETTITADSGYDGLRSVDVDTNVQPDLETKSITITENTTTTITPTSGKDGLSSVEITTDVQSGGGEDFIYPELTKIYDSSCIGGGNATTLTTSVNALKDNIVYAVICARASITVPSGWTFLKSEKQTQSNLTQTIYIYYKIPTSDGSVSFTVNQSSNVRMFLSLFAMNYSYKTPINIKSAEVSLVTTSALQPINNINLVKGDFLAITISYVGSGANDAKISIDCNATKYATNNEAQRLVIYRIEEDVKDIIVTLDSPQPTAGTFCYIVMTPQIGTNNSDLLVEIAKQAPFYTENQFSSVYGFLPTIREIPYNLELSPSVTSLSNAFNGNTNYSFAGLTSVDFLKYWNTSNVTNMSNMFYATKMTCLDLSNFITTNVTNMSNMFATERITELKYIDFRNATIKSTTNCSNMFYFCNKLEFLDIRNMDLTLLTNSSYYNSMFYMERSSTPTLTIIVKNNACKQWILDKWNQPAFVIKTAEEYEGS